MHVASRSVPPPARHSTDSHRAHRSLVLIYLEHLVDERKALAHLNAALEANPWATDAAGLRQKIAELESKLREPADGEPPEKNPDVPQHKDSLPFAPFFDRHQDAQ